MGGGGPMRRDPVGAASQSEVSDADFPWVEAFFRNRGAPGYLRFLEPCWHYRRLRDEMVVIVSGRREDDGKRWVHVSCSHRNRLPTWDTLREVKDIFIGVDRKAVVIFPPEAECVNHHEFALHLWHCLDGDDLPDLRVGGLV